MHSEARDETVDKLELPQSQSELPTKRMIDSYREAVIPLGTDKDLRGKYVNAYNLVRYGRIMEDLDTMAGMHATLSKYIWCLCNTL